MNVDFAPRRPDSADALVLPVRKGELAGLDAELPSSALVRQAAEAARFTGAAGQSFESFVEDNGRVVRILLVGLGEGSGQEIERAGGQVSAKLLTSGAHHAALLLSALTAEQASKFALAAMLRGWRYDRHRTKLPDAQKISLERLTVVGAEGVESGWERAHAVAEGVALTRELVTEPANIIYPESFVERCRKLADLGVELRVLGEDEMRELGMGALLGVAQGSARPPRLLVMRWNGTGSSDSRPVCLVGKGVTFDTGGISIKPAAGMEDMKWDMGGAAAVAGTMAVLAGRKARAHVVGVCGLVENMPDGNAQRPGDVVTSMSGQTIEVINTDAEGRLVLCDAMYWVQKEYRPEVLVDLATLTGAMIISLGHEHGGLFSNDDALADQLLAAGREVGEPLWRQPLGKAYDKLIDSQIADMKNVGPRYAGSITAAQFLQRFVEEGVKWAHLDIAGMVWSDKDGAAFGKGATGYGVRLLDRFIAENHEG